MSNQTHSVVVEADLNFEIISNLRAATREAKVAVEFRDGKCVEGAILFNESKGVGKVINIDEEVSVDFRVEQLVAVRI